ncbi:unknown similar to AMEV264 [Mythimna separata entomopoxvirus 'L']|uniref:Uncharacterized protein n=1 Tax=Mythimna separata entomopoxvirus 'L' TaxID=1293572 RepID=A0A916P7R2_9POXV|nr:unknown similar to AMEV264 [Mythimna separata entomopoxvirus 'L']CCU56486.1 unknown similar to AMEV264 [Mythimna separata entomopoxvirus 'L']
MDSIDKINIDLEVKNNDPILLYGILFGYFLRICNVICDKNKKKIINTEHDYFNLPVNRSEIIHTNNTLIFKNKILDYMDGSDSYVYDNYFITLRKCGTSTNSEVIYMKRISLYYTRNEYLSSTNFNISDYKCEYNKMICKTFHNKTYKYLVWNKIENNNLNKNLKNIDINLEYDGYNNYYFIDIKNKTIGINKNKIKINNTIYTDSYNIKINDVHYIEYKNEIVSDNYYNIMSNNKNYISYGWVYVCIVIIVILLIYIVIIIIKYNNNKNKNNKNNSNAIYIELDDL